MASLSDADLFAELSLNDEKAASNKLKNAYDEICALLHGREAVLERRQREMRQGTAGESDVQLEFELKRNDVRAAETKCRELTDAIRRTTSQERRGNLELELELAQNDLREHQPRFRELNEKMKRFKALREAVDNAKLELELARTDERAARKRMQDFQKLKEDCVKAHKLVHDRRAALERRQREMRQGTAGESDVQLEFELKRNDVRAAETKCRELTDAIRRTTSQERRGNLELELELAQNDLREHQPRFRELNEKMKRFKALREAVDNAKLELELARTDERAAKKKKDDSMAAILS